MRGQDLKGDQQRTPFLQKFSQVEGLQCLDLAVNQYLSLCDMVFSAIIKQNLADLLTHIPRLW